MSLLGRLAHPGDRTASRITWALAGVHVLILILAAVGRLTFLGQAVSLLAEICRHPLWVIGHAAAALLLIAALLLHNHRATACIVSTSILGCWGALNVMWGIELSARVSLLGPSLVVACAGIAALLAWHWSSEEI